MEDQYVKSLLPYMCMGGEDVLLYLVTVDNLGQIVCTSCIQTAANRVICYVPTQEVVFNRGMNIYAL